MAEIKAIKNLSSYRNNRQMIDAQNKRFKDFYDSIPSDLHRVCIANQDYFNSQYCKVIVGSDQVWNPKYFCNTYFLDFVESSRRYSYAPSMGVSHLTSYEKNYLAEKLEPFQRISVREETGCMMLRELFPDREIMQVCDPTLLLSGDEWLRRLQIDRKEVEEPYILVYTLADNNWYKKAIAYIQSQLGVNKIIYITPIDCLYFYKSNKLAVNVGPKEFLELLYHASYVITDSFHGVCFSVNFQKNFLCFQRFNQSAFGNENSRVSDLLKELNLSDKFVKSSDTPNVMDVDYSAVDEQLNKLREKSKCYLAEIVSEKVYGNFENK